MTDGEKEVYRVYLKVCKQANIEPLTYKELEKYIDELDLEVLNDI